MSHFSDYLENGLINATLRGTNFTAPTTIYLALFTTDPTDAGTGEELSDSNYARQDAAKGGSASEGWTPPADGVTQNEKLIQFPPIADGNVTITHYAVFDAAVGGNMLYHAPLTTSKNMEIGDVVSFDVGAITVALR
jgi:hypothetical protein